MLSCACEDFKASLYVNIIINNLRNLVNREYDRLVWTVSLGIWEDWVSYRNFVNFRCEI